MLSEKCNLNVWGITLSAKEEVFAVSLEMHLKLFFSWMHIVLFYFLLNLLGWHWLIKLCRFKVYNSIMHHLCIVLCVHHFKSSVFPSPFISLYPHLPCPPLFHHIVLCLWVFSLYPLTIFTQPHSPLLSDNYQSVLCLDKSISTLLVYSIH